MNENNLIQGFWQHCHPTFNPPAECRGTGKQLESVWQRCYIDFLMGPRLEDYRRLLEQFVEQGYRLCSVWDFFLLCDNGEIRPPGRFIVLRCDVDTDPATALAMWQIENELGIKGSYYFRLHTADITTMRKIWENGCEVGYHYEEIATVAKRHRLRTREQVLARLPEIQTEFETNLDRMRQRTGLPLRTAAAHGDFMNRRLKMTNAELLRNSEIRRRARIELEAYDEKVTRFFDTSFIDRLPPCLWSPSEPANSSPGTNYIVRVLVHPRNWRSCIRANLRHNWRRLVEEAHYRLG